MARQQRKARHHPLHPRNWLIWPAIPLVWMLAQLPWRVVLLLGRGFGHLSWYLSPGRRHIAITNIRLCFPELDGAQQNALARRTLVSTGEATLEIAATYFNRYVRLEKRLEVTGLGHLHRARQEGKGVLLLGMHLNSIDVGARLLGEVLGEEFSAVYRPNDIPVLDWLIRKGRQRYVKDYIDRKDLRGLVRELRRGGVCWYAPDQAYRSPQAVFAPFFGMPAHTITATSKIARLSNARVIPIAHYRLPGARYRLELGAPLENFPSGSETSDAECINRTIEHFVRKAPEQYLWVHRRFKRQPDGKNPYNTKPAPAQK